MCITFGLTVSSLGCFWLSPFFGNYLLLHLLLPALWQIIICQMADNDISFFYFFSHEEKRAHLHHHELVAQSTSRCLPSLSWTIWHWGWLCKALRARQWAILFRFTELQPWRSDAMRLIGVLSVFGHRSRQIILCCRRVEWWLSSLPLPSQVFHPSKY